MTYQADTFFEDLDESPDWEMVEEGDEQTCFDIEFYFTEYRRKNEKQNARDKGKTGRKKRRNHRKSGFSVFSYRIQKVSVLSACRKLQHFFLNIIFELYQLNFSGGTFLAAVLLNLHHFIEGRDQALVRLF